MPAAWAAWGRRLVPVMPGMVLASKTIISAPQIIIRTGCNHLNLKPYVPQGIILGQPGEGVWYWGRTDFFGSFFLIFGFIIKKGVHPANAGVC
jgi:hypothetical protein